MNKIETLIKERCPNGVEWREVGEVANVGTGNNNTNEQVEEGEYPFFVRSKSIKRISTYSYDEKAIIIPGEGGIGEIFHYIDGKYGLHQRAYRIHFFNTKINTKFIYYYMQANFKSFIMKKAVSATVQSIRKPMIEKFKIPIPPLEIQEEIVKILDKFTDYVTELTTELTLRQKQYNYYRDKLLLLDKKEVELVKLSKICKIYDGTHQTPKYTNEGVPFVSVENIKNLYSTLKHISNDDYKKFKIKPKINDIFMTRIGDVGTCTVVDRDEDLAYYVSLALIRPDTDYINPYYLKYYIESTFGRRELNKRILHTAVPIKINMGDIGKIMIPLPSLEIQNRVVKVLDNFETIINDISNGLPKEIELRQKQYEYYRDKLLSVD
ncbi:restriction endonuclease subunit S [Streptococcus uberis]|nr:restriction endonuclease subunit S [Streptococcus uberis]